MMIFLVFSSAAFWTQAFGSFGQRTGDGNAAHINRTIGGIFLGADTLIADKFLLGLAGGYSNSSFTVPERASTSRSDNYHLSGYGGTQWGPVGLRVGAAHAWHVLQTTRNINFGGFSDNPRGNYTAGTTQVFGELGYTLPTPFVSLEPFVRAAYVHFNAKGFGERGGSASLQSNSSKEGVTYTTVGLNALKTFLVYNRFPTTMKGTLGWRHALGNLTPLSTFAFDTGSSFVIGGMPIAGDAMVMAAGMDTNITEAATLSIYYNGQVFNNIVDNGLRANFSWRF